MEERNEKKPAFYYLTDKGNVIGSSTKLDGLKPATHEDFEKQIEVRKELYEKLRNTPERIAEKQSKLFGQVVTELSTGTAAIKTAQAGVSYPNIRKASLLVCEAAEFKGSVKELTEKALVELKIE